MPFTYRSALLLLSLPLVLGVLIFLLWFWSGEGDLEVLGSLVLFFGWVPVLLGFGFLLVFRSDSRQLGLEVGQIRRAAWLAVLLGLSNFPAAALVLYGVFVCSSYCAFTVVNRSGESVQDIELRIGNARISLGKLGPSKTRFQRVFIKPSGAYRVTARCARREFDSVDNAYAAPSLSTQMLITFEASGSLLVEEFDEFD